MQKKLKVWAAAAVRVLVSRPVRPYEVAIGLAILRAIEKALGVHLAP